MLERKAYQDLLKWKAKKGRTALLVRGRDQRLHFGRIKVVIC